MDSKAWYTSKAIWGGIVAIVAALSSAIFGITLGAEDQEALVNVIATVAGAFGGLLAIYGRVKASAPIGKPADGAGS